MKTLLIISALFAALIPAGIAEAAGPSVQQAEISASDGLANQAFGAAIAASGDTLVVAPIADNTSTKPSHGVAYVFERPAGSDWAHAKQVARLTLSGEAEASIGSVAIDGDTIVVGGTDHRTADKAGAGAAFVFVKPAGGWKDAHEDGNLTADDAAANDGLGLGVAVSGDTVVASSPGHKVGTHAQQGAVYV